MLFPSDRMGIQMTIAKGLHENIGSDHSEMIERMSRVNDELRREFDYSVRAVPVRLNRTRVFRTRIRLRHARQSKCCYGRYGQSNGGR